MAPLDLSSVDAPAGRLNVADRLSDAAAVHPAAIAVACPRRFSPGHRAERRGQSGTIYSEVSFADLDADATTIARGLVTWGVEPGSRLVLLVRPGIEFVTLVFALLRAGVTLALIDPGLPFWNLIRCLAEVEPDGFVAVPQAQAVRALLRRKFSRAKWNVTVGRRWFWGGLTLAQLRELGERSASVALPQTHADDPAAVLFTSGSTGPAKGVLYTQRMFDAQVAEIQSAYGIEPGAVDLACFPLFALFNSAMGVTTVLPDMDFSRPAAANPRKLLAAANDWQATQAFASPAVWRTLSAHCAKTGERIETLRQIFSCGAPVPAEVLRDTLAIAARDAQMHTPYGATECLPVATIEAAEVLAETVDLSDQGAGVCVGRRFGSIDWRVIRITDEPIATIDEAEELPAGEIGELIVRGPQASPGYVTRTECNVETKIANSSRSSFKTPLPYREGLGEGRIPRFVAPPLTPPRMRGGGYETASSPSALPLPPSALAYWHRMGDVGYFDEQGRFWYCGRKSQRVETADGTLFTECVEAVFNRHPDVAKSALVGLGTKGEQIPQVFYEPHEQCARSEEDIVAELVSLAQQFEHTRSIKYFSEFEMIPVDVRHNAKIRREEMADWAEEIDLLYLYGLKPKS